MNNSLTTRIKCCNESIFYICKFLKDGYCTREEVELEFELQGSESMYHWMVCSHANLVTNGSPEWEQYKNNRTEEYRKGDE